MKRVGIVINQNEKLGKFLKEHLDGMLGKYIHFEVIYLDSLDRLINADLVLVMAKEKIFDVIPYVHDINCIIPISRSISVNAIDALKELKAQKVLVVNDVYETTIELMTSLHTLVGNHLVLIPIDAYQTSDDVKLAITANESNLVPKGLEIIDVGFRPLDVVTILKIVEYLDLSLNVVREAMKANPDLRVTMTHSVENQLERYEKMQSLSSMIARESEQRGFATKYSFADFLYRAPAMKQCIEKAKKIAKHDINILLFGETGTGKEMFAQAIHKASSRNAFPFVAVNVTAIPLQLIESEMFGYSDGAFTGAKKGGKKGLFELCHGGTLFLDEIGDMPLDFQAKLLRVIQEGAIMPLGSNRLVNVDVRIVAATNKDILTLVKEGRFREDLYYRLKSAIINIPPLRKRKEDMKYLISSYLPNVEFSDEAMLLLENHEWRGNVRELKQTCEYIEIMADSTVEVEHLPDDIRTNTTLDRLNDDVYLHVNKPYWILESIDALSRVGKSAGRLSILEWNLQHERRMTESEIKRGLVWLKGKGFIVQHKGRKGSVITSEGKKYLATNKS